MRRSSDLPRPMPLANPVRLTSPAWLVSLLLLLAFPGAAPAQRLAFSDADFDAASVAQIRAALDALPAADYEKKRYAAGGRVLPYRLLRPKELRAHERYPLVVTLHNSSRIGRDNEKQLEPLARIWLRADIRRRYPAFVIAPQFETRSSTYAEDPVRQVPASSPSADARAVLALVGETLADHPEIDRDRVYLVGYSMGASTAQNLMSLAPDLFAALVSIAGVPDFSNLRGIGAKPIWLIHGRRDEDNPYAGSVRLDEALQGDRRVRFTTYNRLDHATITIPFLLSEDLPAWLFGQKR